MISYLRTGIKLHRIFSVALCIYMYYRADLQSHNLVTRSFVTHRED